IMLPRDITFFFFSSRRRHTRSKRDWSSDVCSSDLSQREKPKRRRSKRVSTGAEKEDWQVGDQVSHKKWGKGTVVSTEGFGDKLELTVAFPAPTGIKKLLAKLAPITKHN